MKLTNEEKNLLETLVQVLKNRFEEIEYSVKKLSVRVEELEDSRLDVYKKLAERPYFQPHPGPQPPILSPDNPFNPPYIVTCKSTDVRAC